MRSFPAHGFHTQIRIVRIDSKPASDCENDVADDLATLICPKGRK